MINYPQEKLGQGRVTHFKFWGPCPIFGMDEAERFKFGVLIMVAVCNRADHYIFALWFLLLSFYLTFLA